MDEIYSEDDILRVYYKYWKSQMFKVNKGHLISKERCIEDWVVINWASPLEYCSTN